MARHAAGTRQAPRVRSRRYRHPFGQPSPLRKSPLSRQYQGRDAFRKARDRRDGEAGSPGIKKATLRPPSLHLMIQTRLLATMPAAVFAVEKAARLADEAVTRRIAVVVAVAIDAVPAMAGMGIRIVVAMGVAGAEAVVVAIIIGIGVARLEAARVVRALVPAAVPITVPLAIEAAVRAIGRLALIVAGVGISRSLVLAVGVRIELRAIAGIIDHLLRHCGRRQRRGEDRGGTQKHQFGGFRLVMPVSIVQPEAQRGM